MDRVKTNGVHVPPLEVSPVLWLFLGLACVLIGLNGIIKQLVVNHPHVICFIVGIVFLGIGCWNGIRQYGLVRILPSHGRSYFERVLQRSIFDILYFNSGISSRFREWGRVFLLQMDLTESEITEVTRGLSSEFLDTILHRNVIDILPPSFRTFLLPQRLKPDGTNGGGGIQFDPDDFIWNHPMKCASRSSLAVDLAIARVKKPASSHEVAVRLLCDKKMQKERMVQQPSLRPVTQFIIRNRFHAPFISLRKSIFDFGAWWFRASEYFSRLASIASLSYPAAAMVAVRGNMHEMSWRKHKLAGICLLASTSFSLFAYQLRKRYPWLSNRNA